MITRKSLSLFPAPPPRHPSKEQGLIPTPQCSCSVGKVRLSENGDRCAQPYASSIYPANCENCTQGVDPPLSAGGACRTPTREPLFKVCREWKAQRKIL